MTTKKPNLTIRGIAAMTEEEAETHAVAIVTRYGGFIGPKGAKKAIQKAADEAARKARGRRDGR